MVCVCGWQGPQLCTLLAAWGKRWRKMARESSMKFRTLVLADRNGYHNWLFSRIFACELSPVASSRS